MRIVYGSELCDVQWGRYAPSGRPALLLTSAATGEPVVHLTVNIPERDHLLGEGEVFVHNDCVRSGRLHDVIDGGLFESTGRVTSAGYCDFLIARLRVQPPRNADDDALTLAPLGDSP